MALLEADQILACLERHRVRYVVIGGVAAVLHGSPQATFDADICPAREPSDLAALALALREMKARIRAPGEGGNGGGSDHYLGAGGVQPTAVPHSFSLPHVFDSDRSTFPAGPEPHSRSAESNFPWS